ncbi:interferon-induced transmembrane protein [Nitzschia inconspicua]|uniref:Interferon-induced transmembrane protein n=1 Tax=Nitzschia inconspicua TaxID=303405 RepID=A0A9K3L7H8_9STRA|nr:interferon-induced transmembrane protein [Nitzschia inconspicua]
MEPNGNRVKPLILDPFEDSNRQIPPPPPSEIAYASLPPGWAAAISPQDGRMYYWEKATGKTSWTHPSAPPIPRPYVAMTSGVESVRPSLNSQPATNVTSTISMDSGASGIIASRSMGASGSDGLLKNGQRPITHQCYAIVATLLFFPLGLFALIYSFKVESAWSKGHTGDSIRYSRRALLFSRISTAVGVIFWTFFIFFRGPKGIDFDFRPLFEW